MLKITKKDKRTNLEKEIDRVLKEAEYLNPNSDDYSVVAENIERLYKAKSCEKSRTVSPDTIAVIAGNLLGIALILGYEQSHVITSKALGFVLKGRV